MSGVFGKLSRRIRVGLPEGRLLLYRRKKVYPFVEWYLRILSFLYLIFSLTLVVTVVMDYGMEFTPSFRAIVDEFYDRCFVLSHVTVFSKLLLVGKRDRPRLNGFAWLVLVLFFFTLIPVLFHRPDQEPLTQLWDIFRGYPYRVGVMSVLSVLTLISGFFKALERHVNPALILSLSFFLIIAIGTGILMLPRCSVGIAYEDALFLATSAVCVTGLSPVDYTSILTGHGMVVLLVLFQVGGLGVMTFTNFFTLFFMGNTSIYSQMVMKDILSQDALSQLWKMLLDILLFTFLLEAMGAFLVFLSVHSYLGMTLRQEIFFSVFHSVSAFCNAGFSSLPEGLSTPAILTGHAPLLLVISFLVILGGLGFPVLVNLRNSLLESISLLRGRLRGMKGIRSRYTAYSLNTRIVLRMTCILLSVSTVLFLLLEWNHCLDGLSTFDKLVHGFFMAVIPRSAGFSSLPVTSWTSASLVLLAFLSAIGGASQSTAGGIKVGTFAVVLLNLRSVLRGGRRGVLFNRELSQSSVNRSNATVMMFILLLLGGFFTLSVLDPLIPSRELFFEALAALSTCGLSLGATPLLSEASKTVMVLLMFIGRLGVLTLAMGLFHSGRAEHVRHPLGEVIIS